MEISTGFFPQNPAHSVSAHTKATQRLFKGSLEWHQRKMRGRLHKFRNSLLVSIQQQHKSRFSAAGGAAPLRTNIVSTCSLVRFLWASFSVCSFLLGEKLFIQIVSCYTPAGGFFQTIFYATHNLCVSFMIFLQPPEIQGLQKSPYCLLGKS